MEGEEESQPNDEESDDSKDALLEGAEGVPE